MLNDQSTPPSPQLNLGVWAEWGQRVELGTRRQF
jgi:hypothetical protein